MYYPFALIVVVFWLVGLLTSRTLLGFIEIIIMITIVNMVYKIISGKISNRKKIKRRKIKYRWLKSI